MSAFLYNNEQRLANAVFVRIYTFLKYCRHELIVKVAYLQLQTLKKLDFPHFRNCKNRNAFLQASSLIYCIGKELFLPPGRPRFESWAGGFIFECIGSKGHLSAILCGHSEVQLKSDINILLKLGTSKKYDSGYLDIQLQSNSSL